MRKIEKLRLDVVENCIEMMNSMRIMYSDLEKRFNDKVDKTERGLKRAVKNQKVT
jgi:hypothetical protein